MCAETAKYTQEQMETFELWWKRFSKRIEMEDVAGPLKVSPPREEDTPRFKPARWPVAPEKFHEHLEKYRKLVCSLGAVDAKIVPARDIPQDLRSMYVGCLNPSCRWLNTNFHCPMERTFPFEDMQEFFSDYQYAVVFKVLPLEIKEVPGVGKIELDMYYTMGGGPPPDKAMLARNIIRLRILSEMERRIRAAAYYDGHLMASPMGSGPCIVSKCADIGRCPALKPGDLCRSVQVQPNGPVAYVDYHTLARHCGWGELQVGGNCAFPEDVPDPKSYYNIGIVLID